MIELRFEITTKKVDLTSILPALKVQARECAGELQTLEEHIIADWKNKPTFKIQETESDMKVIYEIIPTGQTLQWRAVSRGTAGKTFGPKTAPALRFPYQGKGVSYMPKTTATSFGGPGVKLGPIRSFKQVNWPGIAPRHFEETVMTKYKPVFRSKMMVALARARGNSAIFNP